MNIEDPEIERLKRENKQLHAICVTVLQANQGVLRVSDFNRNLASEQLPKVEWHRDAVACETVVRLA